jgi:hypothetical protein
MFPSSSRKESFTLYSFSIFCANWPMKSESKPSSRKVAQRASGVISSPDISASRASSAFSSFSILLGEGAGVTAFIGVFPKEGVG